MLDNFDLLRRFEALVTHESVSGAAGAMGMTQPGMSIALAKLRRALADPVLVRAQGRMVATERAKALLPEVREILRRTEALGRTRTPFDPATTTTSYSLALMDSVATLLLPGLVRQLAQAAPHASLACRASNHELLQSWFDEGEIHLGIGYHPRPPGHLHARILFADAWALLVGSGHPFARGRVTAARLLRTPLLKVSPAASDAYWDVLVAGLAAAGGTPIAGTSVPSFLVAAHIVAETDLVAVVPMRLARSFATRLPVRAVPCPLALPPPVFGMRWHPRAHTSPEHRWFRALASAYSRAAMEGVRERAAPVGGRGARKG
ncbi:MAG: LysR family transcriptional regulator [Burkholderiales bacterium]